MEENFIESFDNSIKMDCGQILVDIADATLDNLLECDFLKVIPFFKVFVAAYKGILGIKERHMIKNTAVFIQELKKHDCDEDKINRFVKKTLKSKKRFEKELERVLVILDKETELEKSAYLGRLFSALIMQKLSVYEFSDYSEILERAHLSDIKIINKYWTSIDENSLILVNKKDVRNFNRMSAQGIGEVVFINNSEVNNDISDDSYRFGFDDYSQKFLHIIFDLKYTNNKKIPFDDKAKILLEGLPIISSKNGNKELILDGGNSYN